MQSRERTKGNEHKVNKMKFHLITEKKVFFDCEGDLTLEHVAQSGYELSSFWRYSKPNRAQT